MVPVRYLKLFAVVCLFAASSFSEASNRSQYRNKAKKSQKGKDGAREQSKGSSSSEAVVVSAKALKYISKMRSNSNPRNVRMSELQLVCKQCFGNPRANGTHYSYPRKVGGQLMTLKGGTDRAKPEEVKKALFLIDQLELKRP